MARAMDDKAKDANASGSGADLPAQYRDRWLAHAQVLLDCYERLVGATLIDRSGDGFDEALRLYRAPFAVLSHGTEADPILNYANAVAIGLWETTIEKLMATPSRLTAEASLQAAREHFLKETAGRGFVTGYSGVRISALGKRFEIENVTIWNLTAPDGTPLGQAATFDRWT